MIQRNNKKETSRKHHLMKENLGNHENKPSAIWSWNIKLAERNIDILKKTSQTVKKKWCWQPSTSMSQPEIIIEKPKNLRILTNYYILKGCIQNLNTSQHLSFWVILGKFYFSIFPKFFIKNICNYWLPRWLSGEESTCQCRRRRRSGFDAWDRKIPWGRKYQTTPCSCLENPMDRETRWPIVHRVAKSWTWLSDWTQVCNFYNQKHNILKILALMKRSWQPYIF